MQREPHWKLPLRSIPRPLMAATLGVVLGGLLACGDDDPAAPVLDTSAPAAIADLTAVEDSTNGRQLVWTSPGDDGAVGQAAGYELRSSATAFTAADWDSLSTVSMTMSPAMAGSGQTFRLPQEFQQGQWYFALRSADEVPNWSDVSNIVHFEAAPVGFPLATSEDRLVDNIAQSLRELNFAEYDRLLEDGFQFWFSPQDAGLVPNGFFWDRASDLASAENMFNGSSGQRPDGSVMPAVAEITVTLTPVEPAWTSAAGEAVGGVTPMPPDARRRRYDMDMLVRYSSGALLSQIVGQQLFYVRPVDVPKRGALLQEWKLLLWREFGPALRTSEATGIVEPSTFGLIKTRY